MIKGRLLDRFSFQGCIGNGAFASIFRAFDHKECTSVAVKRVMKNPLKKSKVLPMSEYTVARDLDHPNIIRTRSM